MEKENLVLIVNLIFQIIVGIQPGSFIHLANYLMVCPISNRLDLAWCRLISRFFEKGVRNQGLRTIHAVILLSLVACPEKKEVRLNVISKHLLTLIG